MRSILSSFLLFICFSSAIGQVKDVSVAELEKLTETSDDSVVVVNFWATWCKPCIQELPYFSMADDSLKNEKIRFLYVSLDFADSKQRIQQTITRHNLFGQVVLITGDPNEWINKIDPAWQGNIPFTVLYLKSGRVASTDKPFHSVNELLEFIKSNVP